jgi:hypothetical protein
MFRLLRPVRTGEQFGGVIAGDASDVATFSYSLQGQLFASQQAFTETEKDCSSGYRELLNIDFTLQSKGQILGGGEEVKIYYWMTDSQNVFYWFKHGSSRQHVQDLLVKIYRRMYALKIRIVIQWLPRTFKEIELADMGSKFQDSDDWGICDKSLNALQLIAKCSITCDTFAYSTNNRCRKYYSKIASPNSAGIDAFAQDWSVDFIFCCPPVKLIPDVLQHLKRSHCQGLLVIPLWPGAVFWPRVTVDGKHLISMFYKHHIFRASFRKGAFCDKNLFDGYQNQFSMICLFFNSTIPVNYDANIKQRCLSKTCSSCNKG